MRMDRRITKTLALAIAAAAPMVSTGCQQASKPAAQAPPMVIDEAMQKRDWPQSAVYVANGDVEAGSTRSRFTPETNDDTYNSSTAQTYGEGLTQFTGGLLNILYLPISRIFQPLNSTETSNGGVDMSPSYTGVPPLAPEPGTLSNQTSPPSPGNPNNAPPGSGTPAPNDVAPPGAGGQTPNPGTPPGADNPGGAGATPTPDGGAGTGVIK